MTVTETIEPPVDLPPEADGGEPPSYHTLLEVWRAVLEPARNGKMRTEKVSPQVATKLVSTYPQVRFADVPAINTMLFEIIDELGQILDDEISTDDQCLSWESAEDDAVNNSEHYKNLLTEWQRYMLLRELDWDSRDENAAVTLAALSEVHNMFFGDKGLTAHLESIKFQFTEADSEALRTALEETRDAHRGRVSDE